MKKIGLLALIIIALLVGVFLWLLAGAGPDGAPQDVRIIDVTPAP